ncbi:MAG: thioredoxin [Ruminococcaceae bacterium]|nr:thioredoxin [Oscillospiraceae bacterium]
MAVLHITEENFEKEVLQAEKPVLLDFWATWCGPCRMMGPILEEYAALHPEYAVGKVNVDEQEALAAAFRIESIPTLVVIKEGKTTALAVGVQTPEQLDALMAK